MSLDDDLIAQLTGNVSASVSLDGGFGVRAELKDPRAFERTLVKVADVLPSFAEGAGFGAVRLSKPSGGRGLLRALAAGRRHGRVRRGGRGAGGGERRARARASSPARSRSPCRARAARWSPAPTPSGSSRRSSSGSAPRFGVPDLGALGTGLLTRPLGDLSGSVSASTGELRGKLTLGFD